jgi:hypothetical protein
LPDFGDRRKAKKEEQRTGRSCGGAKERLIAERTQY